MTTDRDQFGLSVPRASVLHYSVRDVAQEVPVRQVIVYPGEDGFWVAECPSLPGCITQGKTEEQALERIKAAIEGYIRALEQDDLPVPEELPPIHVVAV